ncbi:MAG: dihydrolipoamide acetyltransferase family protein [Candidatus Omnitrophota bacterium]
MDIRVPQLAEGVEAGTVVAVRVKAGDRVEKGQTVAEIESNKAVAAIPAPESGTVSKVLVKEGDAVNVGAVLLSIGAAGVFAPKESPAPAEKNPAAARPAPPVPAAAPVAAPVQSYSSGAGFPPPASPTVRKLARDLGIDLTRVRGTDPGGRVTMADLRTYVQYLQNIALTGAESAEGRGKAAPKTIDFSKWGPVIRKPMSQLRRTIAQAMSESAREVPRVTQFDDLEIGKLAELRKKFAQDYEKKNAKLTLTAVLLKLLPSVLKELPDFNASLDPASHEIIYKEYYHLGIAVDTEHGLFVPVIRDADKKSLLEVCLELQAVAEKARTRKLTIEEMQGGTFTVSNQGAVGGKHFTPIINLPEVAILGLGRGYEAPVVRDGTVKTALLLPAALSYDHRVIDGAQAARFMVAFAAKIAEFGEKEIALS